MSRNDSTVPIFEVIPMILFGLVVCMILGIVATVRFNSIRMRRTEATSVAMQLKSAAGTYFTEYRMYPVRDEPEDLERVVYSNHELMDVLMASRKETGPNGLNPLGIVFCSFESAERTGEKSLRRGGVKLDADGGGELWDPWGNHYRVTVDTNFDHQIAAPSWVKDVDVIPQGVIVWSPGPDGDDNTAEDNIITW